MRAIGSLLCVVLVAALAPSCQALNLAGQTVAGSFVSNAFADVGNLLGYPWVAPSPLTGNSLTSATGNSPEGPSAVKISDGPSPYTTEFALSAGSVGTASADITTSGEIVVSWTLTPRGISLGAAITFTSTAFSGLTLSTVTGCAGTTASLSGTTVTLSLSSSAPVTCTAIFQLQG